MYNKISKSMQALCLFTIIITIFLVLAGSYASFNNTLKNELKNEAVILASIMDDSNDSLALLHSMDGSKNDKRITLISNDGTVVFDSNEDIQKLENHSNRPEIIDAKNKGVGEVSRYSATLGTSVSYYAIRLKDDSILRLSSSTHNTFKMFIGLSIPVLFIFALIYILCVVFSTILTDNITRPINNINLSDIQNENYTNVYDEITPFVDRIRAQNAEIERQMDKLRERKSRLQTISDNLSEGLIITDTAGGVLSINQSAADIFKVSSEEVMHKSFWYCSRSIELSQCLKKASDGEKATASITIEDNTYNAFYSPVFKDSTITGVVILFMDITDKIKTEQMKREFTANVSHELKTPLTTILGYSQIISNQLAKPEDIVRFTQKIEKESTRLINLIDDIIKLSKLDEQKQPEELQSVAMLRLCCDVVDNLHPKALEKKVSIDITGENFCINANPSQIDELVYNLIDNAIKYNRDDGRVLVNLGKNFLSVKDTGIGIPKEYLGRIFERFFRVDKSRSKSVNGTGLGLSIVKHIAEANNATISVKSEPNLGTEITVTFNDLDA